MFPKGIIYQKGKSPQKGEKFIKASRMIRFGYGLLRGLGSGLVGSSIIALIFTFGPVAMEEAKYNYKSLKGESGKEEVLPYEGEVNPDPFASLVEAQNVSGIQKETEGVGIDSYFSIYIPKIDAKSNVIANVDSADKKEYLEALKKGIAHAKGTYFPGQGKTVYLFSHSTDSPLNFASYNAVFYLLRKLEAGDKIFLYFSDKRYEYVVEEKLVTAADDTSWLNEGNEERLILQTCDPPGTTWKRLIIVARPAV